MNRAYIIFLVLTLGLVAIFSFSINRINPRQAENLVGGDKDEHGCVASAGYTWCELKQKCLREWEEACQTDDIGKLLIDLKEFTQISFSDTSSAQLD